jgi:hypothetical protein
VFVSKIQPWSGGGGSNSTAPPVEMIISNTLSVTPSGADTEIELINGFSLLLFADPLQPVANSNVFVDVQTNFTLIAPSGGSDGATVNMRFVTNASDNEIMSIDTSILVPDQLADLFPFTILSTGVAWMTLQFDNTSAGGWYIANFLSSNNA